MNPRIAAETIREFGPRETSRTTTRPRFRDASSSWRSAAADELHDLDAVALGQGGMGVLGARHDLEVALDRHLARVQPQLLRQGRDGRSRHLPGLAVDFDPHAVTSPCVGGAPCDPRPPSVIKAAGFDGAPFQRLDHPLAKPLYVLNGPNLNLLGEREPEVYGRATLADIQALCEAAADGQAVVFRQTNHEGELIDWLHEARGAACAVVLNPAGWGHTSVALHDALKTLDIPVVECHLSNPAARERFRRTNFVSPVAAGVVSGFGPHSYEMAVKAALGLVRDRAGRATAPA